MLLLTFYLSPGVGVSCDAPLDEVGLLLCGVLGLARVHVIAGHEGCAFAAQPRLAHGRVQLDHHVVHGLRHAIAP